MTRDDIRPPANDGYRSDDRTQADALDRAWDERLRPRSPRTSPSSIPSARARMLDQIQALAARDAAVAPDTRARIWHSTRVMAGIPAGREQGMVVPDVMPPTVAGPPISMVPLLAGTGRTTTRRRRPFWIAIQVAATAALILATVAIIINQQVRPPSDHNVAGPSTSNAIVTALPDTPKGEGLFVSLTRITVPPGTSVVIAPGASHVIRGNQSRIEVAASEHASRQSIGKSDTVNLDLNGAKIRPVGDETATVTLLTLSRLPDRSLPSASGATVQELFGYDTHYYVGRHNLSVLLTDGSATQTPQPPVGLEGLGSRIGGRDDLAQAALVADSGNVRLNSPSGPVQSIESETLIPVSDPTGMTLEAGQSVWFPPGHDESIQQAVPNMAASYTLLVLYPAPDVMISTPASATPAAESQPVVTTLATFPAGTPLTTEFYRVGLDPNSTWAITPGPNGPLAVLAYAAAGSATLTTSGSAPVMVGTAASAIGTAANVSQTASLVGNGVTITTAAKPASIYLAVINHGPQNFDLTTVPGSVVFLGVSADRSLVQPTGAGQGTRSVRIALSRQQLAGEASDTLAADSGLLMLSPLDGTIDLTGRAGDVFVRPGAGPGTATPAAAEPIPLTLDTSVSAQPGSQIQIAAGDAPVTYLLLQVVPVATPATPAAGSTPTGTGATPAP